MLPRGVAETPAQVIRFLVIGIGNTVMGLAVIYLCIFLVGTPEIIGNLIGYLAGLLLGFCFNRNWTFASNSGYLAGFGRYLRAFALATQLI
jgi:putative flippase GtrA